MQPTPSWSGRDGPRIKVPAPGRVFQRTIMAFPAGRGAKRDMDVAFRQQLQQMWPIPILSVAPRRAFH